MKTIDSSMGLCRLLLICLIFGLSFDVAAQIQSNSFAEEISKTRSEIIRLGKEDQKERRLLDSLTKNDQKYSFSDNKTLPFDYTKISLSATIAALNRNDSVRSKRIQEILKKYGWPTRDQFGDLACQSVFLIIQHSRLSVQKQYFPLLESAAKNDQAPLEYVALMKDRILTREGKEQLYGTQVQVVNGRARVFPIYDKSNVNKRRSEMGLEPLETYLKQFGVVDY